MAGPTGLVDRILQYICIRLSDLNNSTSSLGNWQYLTSAELQVTLKNLVLQGKIYFKIALIKVTSLKLFVQSPSTAVKASVKPTYSRKCMHIICIAVIQSQTG